VFFKLQVVSLNYTSVYAFQSISNVSYTIYIRAFLQLLAGWYCLCGFAWNMKNVKLAILSCKVPALWRECEWINTSVPECLPFLFWLVVVSDLKRNLFKFLTFNHLFVHYKHEVYFTFEPSYLLYICLILTKQCCLMLMWSWIFFLFIKVKHEIYICLYLINQCCLMLI
jgi:hypothetical protein